MENSVVIQAVAWFVGTVAVILIRDYAKREWFGPKLETAFDKTSDEFVVATVEYWTEVRRMEAVVGEGKYIDVGHPRQRRLRSVRIAVVAVENTGHDAAKN